MQSPWIVNSWWRGFGGRLNRLTIALAACVIAVAPRAAPGAVQISTEIQGPEAATLLQAVREQIGTISPQANALDVRVTIGAEAFRRALAQDEKQPLVAAFLTNVEFEEALAGRVRPPNVTAVFSNPDPRDQFALARTLMGNATIGVFDSPATHSLVQVLAPARVRSISVLPGENIDALLRELDAIDVLIVLPDPDLINRSNINHVVRTLYQQRKVLLGYSATLTRVGSLASVYVTPESVARAIATFLQRYVRDGSISAPVFVRDVARWP